MDRKNGIYTINISRETIINIIVLGLIVFALFSLKSLVYVVLTSVVLASFIRTSAGHLKDRIGLNRVLSVVSMYLVTLILFAGIFYYLIPIIIHESNNLIVSLSDYLPDNLPLIVNVDLNTLKEARDEIVQGEAVAEVATGINSVVSATLSGVGNTLSVFFGGLLNVVLVVIISFYLSVSRDGIESFLRILSPIQREEYVIGLWKRSQRKIALWMQGQMLLGLVVGILTFIGLSLIHVPNAVLLGLVAGIFELIPFGIFLAAIPAVSLAFTSGGLTLALMTIALYIIVQQLEGYLISPLVMNRITGVSPLVVILSVLVGVNLAGFWGLILAVPVAVTALEYVGDLEKERLKRLQNV
ncbi:AI-2E family transporter [Candidatus Nomurabacteria bacterium]|nr:AI-2E family transporter [Candidatus Nomurabacteria bacterium]